MNTCSTAHLCLVLAAGLVSTSAWSQTVTFGDLEGFVIEAKVVRNHVQRRDGRQFPVQAHVDWKIVVGSKDSIETTVVTTLQTPRGLQKRPPSSASITLGQTRQVSALGGGHALWQFEDGTLKFVRTFQQGAFKSDFALSRGADGFTCTIRESYLRENGSGAIVWQSPVDGRPRTLIRSEQGPSTCRVSKTNAGP